MAYKEFNPNPHGKRVGDCVVRAIAKATDESWDRVYIELCMQGFAMGDMPTANHVWGNYLRNKGFSQIVIEDDCNNCFNVKDFCNEYFSGTYILGTGTHVIAVQDGNYYDTWDSGNEIPVYFWEKVEEKHNEL